MEHAHQTTTVDATGATCALRKVSVLTHWVPGVGATISQAASPSIRVATFPSTGRTPRLDLDPCSFRRALVEWTSGITHDVAEVIDPDGRIVIDMFTDETTELSEHGMVLHRVREDLAVVAFATLLQPDECREVGAALAGAETQEQPGRPFGGQRVDFERDVELGVTLAHTSLDPHDPADLQRIHDVMLELVVSFGAVEAVQQFESLS
ncbi:MAG: hypothetical protein AAGG08_13120 [Actinomycetota bacterium]